VKFNKKLYM